MSRNWPDNIAAVTTADVTAAAKALFKRRQSVGHRLAAVSQGSRAPLDAMASGNITSGSAGPIR